MFIGFSVNVVRTKTTVTAILNSMAAEAWFKVLAKPRGIRYEISGSLLESFRLPIPRWYLVECLE